MSYHVTVIVKPEDAEKTENALHELCVSVYEDSEAAMKKLPDVLGKRLPTVLSMHYEKDNGNEGIFFVYFPLDLPYGMSIMMFQAKRKFRKIIREFLESKGIKAEIK